MWALTCLPVTVYNVLYKLKPIFRCAQARHFGVFCWLLIALILDHGKGTLKELCGDLPPKLRYWTLMRMVRSGQWDADVLVSRMSRDVRNWLPTAADGVIHLSAEKTRKDKRGRKHPLGLVTRESAHSPYRFGFEMVLLIASWNPYRIPIRLILLHVMSHPMPEGMAAEAFALPYSYLQDIEEQAQQMMEDYRVRVQGAGLEGDIVLVTGVPYHSMVEVARERQVDLIVVGTQGYTGADHLRMGSVAEKVVGLAPCSVLITRPVADALTVDE